MLICMHTSQAVSENPESCGDHMLQSSNHGWDMTIMNTRSKQKGVKAISIYSLLFVLIAVVGIKFGETYT